MSHCTKARAVRKRPREPSDSAEDTAALSNEICQDENECDSPIPKRSPQCPLQGRRVTHMLSFAEALACCKNPACGQPIVLLDCKEEARGGMGSVLKVPCRACKFVNNVDTDSRAESEQQRGPQPFSSNHKLALGKRVRRFSIMLPELLKLSCNVKL